VTVSPEEVRHIARLARLELSDGEVERFRRELTTILAYVEKLEELEAAPAAEPAEPDQPLRDDVLAPWPDVAALHAAAPDFEAGFFRVPRVIE
jgi:aspartyl-tRNA(Asn)/glutamyl-tRNA(Gln) amidotransferase subunit C